MPLYKVISNGEKRVSTIPGTYAGSKHLRIFGRLDCPSGKRKLAPSNRIFFSDWKDAIDSGYRPCRICKPDEPRLDERLSDFHPALDRFHVAIFETSPRPYRAKPSVCFYVTLNWNQPCRGGKRRFWQLDLEEWFPYPVAIAKAIAWGKKLGLPVIDHFFRADNRVRYLPPSVSSEQRRERQNLVASREAKRVTYTPMG